MSQTENTAAEAPKKSAPAGEKAKLGRRTLRKLGREKRYKRLREDQEFAKAYFGGRSKRSADRKVAWRRRHSKA